MPASTPKPALMPHRLCSEVQLFDLCDLDSCNFKSGRFCSDPALIERFEKIAEEEVRVPLRTHSEDFDGMDSDDSDGYDGDDSYDIDGDSEDDSQEDKDE